MALATGLLGANQAAPSSAQSPPQFEALPLVRSQQNHLLVRAYINGKPAWLCVDSGAPVSAIALYRRSHFGLTGIPGSSKLPPRLQINGGFSNVAIARRFRLGALNLVDEPVVEAALGPEVPRNGGPASRAVDDVVDLQEVVLARSLGSCSRRRAAGSCA